MCSGSGPDNVWRSMGASKMLRATGHARMVKPRDFKSRALFASNEGLTVVKPVRRACTRGSKFGQDAFREKPKEGTIRSEMGADRVQLLMSHLLVYD